MRNGEGDGTAFSENIKRGTNGGFSELEKNTFVIEDDPKDSYCYPAIFAGDNYLLVVYYHSAGTDWCLNCAKVTKIMFDEFEK